MHVCIRTTTHVDNHFTGKASALRVTTMLDVLFTDRNLHVCSALNRMHVMHLPGDTLTHQRGALHNKRTRRCCMHTFPTRQGFYKSVEDNKLQNDITLMRSISQKKERVLYHLGTLCHTTH